MVSNTKQQWFDGAVRRAGDQRKSIHAVKGGCTYLAQDDLPGCFIGVSLDPETAERCDSKLSSYADSLTYCSEFSVVDAADVHEAAMFLQELQRIHDNHEPDSWSVRLAQFAQVYGLIAA